MAIQKRFIHFKKFSDFNSKKLSANEANTQYTVGVSGAIQNGEPDILYQSYCWIKDTKQQWTHAQLYGSSTSEANVQAVDTGDVIDDVTVDYATKAYVDGLVGDINSVLESIISGGPSINLISITVNDSYAGTSYVCQAEEGMTWVDWINSKYNTYGWYRNYGYIFLSDNIVLAFQGSPFGEPTLTEYVMEDGAVGFHTYNLDTNN